MKKIILVVLFIVSNTAYANGKWCSGKITNSYIEHTGNVYIIGSWRGDHTKVCNINTEWRGVTTETCKMWVSYIQVALISQSPVTMHYGDIESCGSIPSYGSAPKPSYIMLKQM